MAWLSREEMAMPIYATQGAATGGARQTSLAARRRFWAVAVSSASSLTPLNPRNPKSPIVACRSRV
jgi:hypothetical protein